MVLLATTEKNKAKKSANQNNVEMPEKAGQNNIKQVPAREDEYMA